MLERAWYWTESVGITIAIWAHIWRQQEKIRHVSRFTFFVPKHKEQVLQDLLYSSVVTAKVCGPKKLCGGREGVGEWFQQKLPDSRVQSNFSAFHWF